MVNMWAQLTKIRLYVQHLASRYEIICLQFFSQTDQLGGLLKEHRQERAGFVVYEVVVHGGEHDEEQQHGEMGGTDVSEETTKK